MILVSTNLQFSPIQYLNNLYFHCLTDKVSTSNFCNGIMRLVYGGGEM